MPTQYVSGLSVREGLRRALSSTHRETVLTIEQLLDSPGGGIGAAVAFYLDGQPSNNDTFVIENDNDGPEAFTFKTALTPAAFEVLIGASVDATMLNLAVAITADSAFWAAKRPSSLDSINDGSGASTAGMVVVIWRLAPVSVDEDDRIYGSLTTAAFGQLVDFHDELDYRKAVSVQLTPGDPVTGLFGLGRAQADLIPDERHGALAEDQTWLWDSDRLEWRLASGEGAQFVVRQYTGPISLLDLVYLSASNTVARASANAVATARPVGFVRAIDEPDPGFCEVTFGGDLGGFLGLTPGKVYILSKTLGGFVAEDDTANPAYPDAAGEVIQEVGQAVTVDTMFVNPLRDFDVLV